MRPQEPYFTNAVSSVLSEHYLIDTALARKAIEQVYVVLNGETGDAFRKLFDKAIESLRIPVEHRRGYELALGRYFNPRAVEKLKRNPELRRGPYIPVVLEADINHVLFQVYPELQTTFVPHHTVRGKQRLEWKDIFDRRELLSGSSTWINPNTYHKMKKQALAILNKYRRVKSVA